MYILFMAIILLLRVMRYAIIARALISWFPISRDNQIVRLLYQITEPLLAPIRGIIERSSFGRNMMIDFSAIIAFVVLLMVENVIIRTVSMRIIGF